MVTRDLRKCCTNPAIRAGIDVPGHEPRSAFSDSVMTISGPPRHLIGKASRTRSHWVIRTSSKACDGGIKAYLRGLLTEKPLTSTSRGHSFYLKQADLCCQ